MRKGTDFQKGIIRRSDPSLQFSDFGPRYSVVTDTVAISDCVRASSSTIIPFIPIIKNSTNLIPINKNINNSQQNFLLNNNKNNSLKNGVLNNTSNNYLTEKNITKIEENSNLRKSCLCKKKIQNNNDDCFKTIKKSFINNLAHDNETNQFIHKNIEKNKIANIEDTDEKIRNADAVFL